MDPPAPPEYPQLTTEEFARKYRGFSDAIPPFHKVWYEILDSGPDRLLLIAPREHAKTSVVLTYALHRLARNRQLRIGIISGNDDLCTAFMRELKRELRYNTRLHADFGGPFYDPTKKWTQHEIIVAGAQHGKDVSIFAASTGKQITGRHCDLLIFDDCETTKTVLTEGVRRSTKAWFAKEALPLLSPGGKAIVIGTRKHYDDLYSALIKASEGEVPEELRVEGDDARPWFFMDNALSVFDAATGAELWPERWPREKLLRRKAELDAVDILAWAQEYENRPLPSETVMFRPQEWPGYDGHGGWDAIPAGATYYEAWDLAISAKETADYTAGVCVAIDEDNTVYVVDCRYGRWNFNAQQQNFAEFGRLHPVAAIGIEAVQYQAAAVQEMARRTMLPVRALTLSRRKQRGRMTLAQDKVARARLLEARAAMGKVVWPNRAAPWKSWLAEQLAFFPAGAHDDGVDALAYAVSMAQTMNSDWDYAYGIYRCRQCAHPYILQPPGYTEERSCPRCGAVPVHDDEGEAVEIDDVDDGDDAPQPDPEGCDHCFCEPGTKPNHLRCCGCGSERSAKLVTA